MNWNLPKKVMVKEVGPRDGFQMEREFIPTEAKVEIIDLLSECGFKDIQATAFVHPKAIPNLADAREVLEKIKRDPRTDYTVLVPNRKGYENADACGCKVVELPLSVTDSHCISNINCTTKEAIGRIRECLGLGLKAKLIIGLACTYGCPFEGRPPFERIRWIADELVKMGIDEIGLADTSGVADPKQVYETSCRMLDAFPDVKFYFHAHNTHGTGVANVLASLQAGIVMYDASVAGLGGCPYAPGASGNVATEDLVQILHYMGIETGIDVDKLIAAAKRTAEVVGHHDSCTLRAGKMDRLVEGGPVLQKND